MGLSYTQIIAPGEIATFAVPFPYLSKEHVHVYVDMVETTAFTWDNDATIRFGTAPTVGSMLMIQRKTPNESLATDYTNGALLDEVTLDNAQRELFYVMQESTDVIASALSVDQLTNTWNFGGKRLANAGDPVNAQDVVTKASLEALFIPTMNTLLSSTQSSASSAATSAASASNFKDTAVSAATAASNAASTATTKADEAAASAANLPNASTAGANKIVNSNANGNGWEYRTIQEFRDYIGAGRVNKIINGDMSISQLYGGTVFVPTSVKYIMDQWVCFITQPSKLTFQRVEDAPPGFKYSQKITVASKFSPGAGDVFQWAQPIEGQNIVDLAFGTATPATITVSFWIKGSVPGKYSISVQNLEGSVSTRSYIGTVQVTSSWTKQTVTLVGDNTDVWATDSSVGMSLRFDLGSGTNSISTANSWQAGAGSRTADSVVFVNQPAGATLNVTGVQLEKADAPSEFEYVPYYEQLRMCQRYYEVCFFATCFNTVLGTASGAHGYFYTYTVPKRTIPALELGTASGENYTNISLAVPSVMGHFIRWHWTTDGVTGRDIGVTSYANARL